MVNFSENIKSLKGSAIREIFKALQNPNIISLAGGSPAPELFPGKELADISANILINSPQIALQYGITEGYSKLCDKIKERYAPIYKKNESLIITSGGQQGLDLFASVMIYPGDGIICENPSFVGALNSFRGKGAKLFGASIEEDGINLEEVEKYLKGEKIKFIYTIPTCQNPSGITMSLKKRQELLKLAKKYNVYILEDNPYGEIVFSESEKIPPIKTMDEDGYVVYAGSFSKIISPGLRVGYLSANSEIMEKIVAVKQASDVHTNVLAQMMVYEFLQNYDIDEHILKTTTLYKKRCECMLSCLDKYVNCSHTTPKGGLFVLCTLKEGVDSSKIAKKALENNVAIVPGNTFSVNQNEPSNMIRLNFSMVSEEKIETAIKKLGNIL